MNWYTFLIGLIGATIMIIAAFKQKRVAYIIGCIMFTPAFIYLIARM